MYYVSDNKIYLTRGDSLSIELDLTDSAGSKYIPAEGDKVEFTVKSSVSVKDPLIVKTGTLININYEDTAGLPFGGYVYDVQVTFANGERDTVIAPVRGLDGKAEPNFILTEEVNCT